MRYHSLLSGKPLCEFTPQEYRAFVIAMFKMRTKRKAPSKKKPFVAKRLKSGKLSLKMNRDPGWLSRLEMDELSKNLSIPLNEIYNAMLEKNVIISTAEEQKRIAAMIRDLPW